MNVFGPGCYMYSFGELYFIVPITGLVFTIRQDYLLDKYSIMEKAIGVDPRDGVYRD